MTPERWRKLEDLYHAASAVDPALRAVYLDNACGTDSDLRREVESLLLREGRAEGFLEPPAEQGDLSGDIGPYRILGPIGAGGMGEVYRAHDRKLGRDVALKVLRRDVAGDPVRLERLQREARLLAALNHPNIASIYGIEESEGITCLVLELVEGESPRGPMPIEKALAYARDLAEALDYAHARGIVHRDLKPANVKVTPDGRVKILDFGLAKAFDFADSATDPVTLPRTGDSTLGLIAGTPSYMSPEQAAGKATDQRTDLWSFGCMLYELLSGKKAFAGADAVEIIEAVQTREPDWTALPPQTPPAVRDLLRRCLRRDASERVQSVAAVRAMLEPAGQRGVPAWSVAAAVVLVLAGVAAYWAFRRPAPLAGGVLQPKPVTSYRGAELFPAISPDAQSVVFTWTGLNDGPVDLFRKPLDGGSSVRLTEDDESECYPAWSPDGLWIAFLHCTGRLGAITSESEVWIVAANGGPKRKIAKVLLHTSENVAALAWMPDGKRLVVQNRDRPEGPVGLHLLDIASGEMRPLPPPPPDFLDGCPSVSGDGRHLAFVRSSDMSHGDIYVADLATGAPAKLVVRAQQLIHGLAWRSPRELVYLVSEGGLRSLWRVRTDGSHWEPVSGTGQVGVQFSLATDGTSLVFTDGGSDVDITRVNLANARPGSAPLPAEVFISSTQLDTNPRYSPDMRKMVFVSTRTGKYELWLADTDGSNQTQFTRWNRYTGSPNWSPNGEEVAADSHEGDHSDIYVADVKTGKERKLTDGKHLNVVPSWSRDGKWVYFSSNRTGKFEIWKTLAHPSSGGADAAPVQVTRAGGFAGAESFDGNTYYYASTSAPDCVKMVPSGGGEEKTVVCPLVWWGYLAMFADGFYYIPKSSKQVWFFDFTSQRARLAFDLKDGADAQFAFSPDRKWLLNGVGQLRGDLYLLNLDR